jgi:hypothetical protein
MTTKKLSEFDQVSTLQSGDLIPFVRTTEPTAALRNKTIAFSDLETNIGASFKDIVLTMPPKTVAANSYAYVDAAGVGYVPGNIILSGVQYFADGLEIKVVSGASNDALKVFYRNISASPVTLPIHSIKVRFFL